MLPAIKALLEKEGKSKTDYLLLIGYFSTKGDSQEDFDILCKLGENYKIKFGKSMYDLSIFKSAPQLTTTPQNAPQSTIAPEVDITATLI